MFDQIDKLLIQKVQEDIPITLDPYGEIAKNIGCSREDVLNRLQSLLDRGILKRIGVILYHRNSGYMENGMFAAVVPAGQIEEVGEKLATLPNVSHCYERGSYPDWPYNLYGMIHGKTKTEVEKMINNFVQDTGIKKYEILFSIEEFKKSSMKYF